MTFHLADIDFAFADQAVNDCRITNSTSDDSAALAAICFGPNVSKASPSGHVEGRACVVDWRRAIAEQCHSTAGACDSSKVLSKVVDDAQDTRPIVAIRVELDGEPFSARRNPVPLKLMVDCCPIARAVEYSKADERRPVTLILATGELEQQDGDENLPQTQAAHHAGYCI